MTWNPEAEAQMVPGLEEEVARLRAALIEIAESDPVDMALDPQWSARIARHALGRPPE